MTRTRTASLAIASLLALAACGDGRDQEGPAENAAEAAVDSLGAAAGHAADNVDRAADSAGARAERATDSLGDRTERAAERADAALERTGDRIERAGDTVRKRTADALRGAARATDPRN